MKQLEETDDGKMSNIWVGLAFISRKGYYYYNLHTKGKEIFYLFFKIKYLSNCNLNLGGLGLDPSNTRSTIFLSF